MSRRSARVALFFVREKAAAEGLLSALRKKGKAGITSKRPEVRPYIGDVRDSYKQMKVELYNYWQSVCNLKDLGHLNVTEDVWMKNIFINERFSGKGADTKLYYEVLDPTNLESWLVFNREQNPFTGLDFSMEVPNRRYAEITGTGAKKLSQSGIHTIKK